MLKRLLPLGALGVLPFVFPLAFPGLSSPPEPIAPDRAIATLFPEHTVGYVETPSVSALLAEGLEHPFVHNVLGSQLGAALLSDAEQSPEELIAFVDTYYGRPVLPLLAKLTSRGVGLGTIMDAGDAKFVVVLLGDDEALLRESLDEAFDLVEQKLGLPGALDEPHRNVRGADVWGLGEEVVIARRETLLAISNDKGLLRDVLELAADAEALGLMAVADFRAHAAEREGDETFWGWLDVARLERSNAEGVKKLRAINGAPATQALLGPGLCALATGNVLSGWITIADREIAIGVRGTDLSPATALMPNDDGVFDPPAPLALGGEVAQGVVYRDYAAYFQNRVELFPPETLPKFSEAVSNFALFFGGKDLGDDVLPGLSPWIQVVSRPLAFEPGRVPETPLPGLALVAELRDPETQGPEITAAFQSLIGVISIDAAQKSGDMMRLKLGLEGETEITSARFLDPGPEDGVDMRYNLEPACAVADGRLVLGTHAELVREVVRALNRGEGRTSAGRGETLHLEGTPIARLIEQNFEALVMNKVLEEGVELEEAEKEIGGLKLLAATIAGADLAVDYPRPDAVVARVRVRLVVGEKE